LLLLRATLPTGNRQQRRRMPGSVPQGVIDAVDSINVRYEQVENVVANAHNLV
jgi:hypothetical protein